MTDSSIGDVPTLNDIKFIECRFTLKSNTDDYWDVMNDRPGNKNGRTLEFEGFASKELYVALAQAVRDMSK